MSMVSETSCSQPFDNPLLNQQGVLHEHHLDLVLICETKVAYYNTVNVSLRRRIFYSLRKAQPIGFKPIPWHGLADPSAHSTNGTPCVVRKRQEP